MTGFQGPILADPDRTLYKTLGMIEHLARAPRGAEKKSYVTKGMLSTIMCSIWVGDTCCFIGDKPSDHLSSHSKGH
jgi:hypothetical protein